MSQENMGMIYHKIFIAEQKIKKDLKTSNEKLETIGHIKDFLNRIDDKVEFIKVSKLIDMTRVISELKGGQLSDNEEDMIEEIFNADSLKINDKS